MASQSTSNDSKSTAPSPLSIATPTSELTLNPLDTLSPNAINTNTNPHSESVSLLQSHRPAPPSPATSRPPSQLLSPSLGPTSPRERSGSSSSSRISGMQRRVSGASSRHSDKDTGASSKPSRRKSMLGQNFSLPHDNDQTGTASGHTSTGTNTPNDPSITSTPIAETENTSTPSPSTRHADKRVTGDQEVLIRDYGFPSTDERFFGRGQPVPQKKWRLSNFALGGRRPSGTASGEGSPRSPDPSDPDDKKSWGFGLFGWRGFARKRSMSSESASGTESNPIHDEPVDAEINDDDDYFSDEQDEGEEPYGTYQVAFSFVSEGANEMSVDEGDIIHVTGRGGGDGWVVATLDGREGLVPEGYLEKIADREEAIEELDEQQSSENAAVSDGSGRTENVATGATTASPKHA